MKLYVPNNTTSKYTNLKQLRHGIQKWRTQNGSRRHSHSTTDRLTKKSTEDENKLATAVFSFGSHLLL